MIPKRVTLAGLFLLGAVGNGAGHGPGHRNHLHGLGQP